MHIVFEDVNVKKRNIRGCPNAQATARCSQKPALLIDGAANRIFTPKYNPLYYTGAISVFLTVLILISGFYVLLFYKINVNQAYDAVERLTVNQWYLGGIMRSIHRYAADALIVVLAIHGLRYLATWRVGGNRWPIWVTGILLLMFLMAEGITGYWMVWDQRSQMIATVFVKFLDGLPIFPKPLSRSFVGEETVTNLLFFVIIILHIALTLIMTALFMIHIARLSRTIMTPPRAISIATLIFILGISIYRPALSAPKADLSIVPSVPIDWFYLFALPVMDTLSSQAAWLSIFGTVFVSIAIAFLRNNRAVTKVIEDNCKGCKLCFMDCPYEAIRMRDDKIAEIMPHKCSGCGTCLGACNFRAIEVGELSTEKLKAEVTRLLGESKKIGFTCGHTVKLDGENLKDVKLINLRCVGMLNPGVIKHAIASGAERVFIFGCRMEDCQYRFGNKWLSGRLSGERAPVLKLNEGAERVKAYWYSAAEKGMLLKELKEEVRREEKPMIIPAVAVLALLGLFIAYFSVAPAYSPLEEGESVLLFTMHHLSERIVPCQEPTLEELKARTAVSSCPRERAQAQVELYVDGELVLSKTYTPKGIKRDEPINAFEKIKVESGNHAIKLLMKEKKEFTFEQSVHFEPGRLVVVDFDESKKEFYLK